MLRVGHSDQHVRSCDCIIIMICFVMTDTIVPTSGTFEVKMVKTQSLNLGITINGKNMN